MFTRIPYNDIVGYQPVFALTVIWGGQVYRFSQYPIEVKTSDNTLYTYTGGLDEFDFTEASEVLGVNVEANEVIVSCVFDGVDFLQEWARGNVLDGSEAELSFFMVDNGTPVSTYDDRVVLFSGQIQQPIFGDPERPQGAVQFTVTSQVYQSVRPLIDSNLLIDDRFDSRDKNSADGKIWPVVFGSAGSLRDNTGATVKIPSTPAYAYYMDTSDPPPYTGWRVRFMVSWGYVQASNVTLWDSLGNNQVLAVNYDTDTYGNPFSYVVTDLAGPNEVITPIDFIHNTDLRPTSWWVSWHDGGGIINTQTNQPLGPAGDLCLWALQRSGLPVDIQAWQNVSTVLNVYEFSGYINDPTVSAWVWLQDNILPYLPIEVRSGPRGLYPILNTLYGVTHIKTVADITEGPTFSQIGPIETQTETTDLINHLTLLYSLDSHNDTYTQRVVAGHSYSDDVDNPSHYAVISQNRYGTVKQTMETRYIYNTDTAKHVANQIIRQRALPVLTLDFVCTPDWGWLSVGDTITMSSDRLHMDKITMLVVERTWQDGQWYYKMLFEVNPNIDKRAV
jgi:hypothetical protein